MKLYFPRPAEVTGSVLQLLTVHHSNFIVILSISEDEGKKKKISLEPSGYGISQSTLSVIVAWELARYILWP